MINWIFKRFGNLPSVYVDGWLYLLIAFFTAMVASFNSDEAAKYIAAWLLFWLRSITGWVVAALLALKMFRSTTFAEHLKQKKDSEEFVRSAETPKP